MSISEEHALLGVIAGDSMDLYVGDLPTLERRPFRSDRLFQANAAISPDGNWTVLVIDGNVYLTRFPGGKGEWQVSPDGGRDPKFSRDGSWIYFVSGQELYRVSFQTEPDVLLGAPDLVGRAEEGTQLTGIQDESSTRYLALQTLGSAGGNLVVVLGWASELGGR